jgi:RNA polymerase sigma factor (sigma-70 family)
MNIVVNEFDEGGCNSWISFFENKTESRRNFALGLRYLGDTYEVEDALQDAFIRVLPHTDIEDKPNYFRMTLRNVCIDRLTDRSRLIITNALPLIRPSTDESEEVAMPVEDSGLNPEMDAERKEKNNRLRRIVEECSQTLTARENDLWRSYLKRETNDEIATRLGEDVKQIRVEMNAVVAKMRNRCRRENDKQGGQ